MPDSFCRGILIPLLKKPQADPAIASNYHISDCTSLWSTEYEQKVIDVLKCGKTGQKLNHDEYHILKTYTLTPLGQAEKVTEMFILCIESLSIFKKLLCEHILANRILT